MSSILNNEKLEGINNDQLIAVVSAYLSAVGNSNHTMFYPHSFVGIVSLSS